MVENGPTVIHEELLTRIRQTFALEWDGIHGLPHCLRVRQIGLRLAERTGAQPAVVELFAFLHDCKRLSNGADPGHGQRAADFIRTVQGSLIRLPEQELEHLVFACAHHTDGLIEGDVTVQTCWDADRLDLWRCHIQPKPERLCTAAARDPEVIRWAIEQSVSKEV